MPISFRGIDCANKSLAYTHLEISTKWEVATSVLNAVFRFMASWDAPYSLYSDAIHARDWRAPMFAHIYGQFDQDANGVVIATERNTSLALKLVDDLTALVNEMADAVRQRIHITDCGVIDMMPGRKMKTVDKIERVKLLRQTLEGIGGGARYTVIEDQPTFNFKSSTIRDQALMYYAGGEIAIIKASLKNKLAFAPHLTRKHFSHMKSYAGNKAHTAANMVYFMQQMGIEHLLQSVATDNYPDLADSFMEIIALYVYIHRGM